MNVITLNWRLRASALGSEYVFDFAAWIAKCRNALRALVVLRFSFKSIRANLCTFELASQLMHACVSMKGTLSTLRRLQRLSARDLPPREDGTIQPHFTADEIKAASKAEATGQSLLDANQER